MAKLNTNDEIDLGIYNREKNYKKSATYKNRMKDEEMESKKPGEPGYKMKAEEWREKNKRKGKTKQEFLKAFLEKHKEDILQILKESVK